MNNDTTYSAGSTLILQLADIAKALIYVYQRDANRDLEEATLLWLRHRQIDASIVPQPPENMPWLAHIQDDKLGPLIYELEDIFDRLRYDQATTREVEAFCNRWKQKAVMSKDAEGSRSSLEHHR
jgi:hypothetical protein